MIKPNNAAQSAMQEAISDADLVRICQSFNPGQDLDLAKAVRAAVARAIGGRIESAPVGYVTASALEAGLDYPEWRSEFFRTAEGLLDYFPTAEPVAVFTAPQASANDVRNTVPEELVKVAKNSYSDGIRRPLGYIEFSQGKRLRDARASCQQRIDDARQERGAAEARMTSLADDARRQYQDELAAGGEPVYPAWVDDVATLIGLRNLVVDDAVVGALASRAYRYAMTLSFAMRNADCDQLEGIARRVTARLKDEIHAIISNQNGRVY